MATLRFNALSKHFGAVCAVDDLDIEVQHGELVCLLGPSGCGKSTALRMIGGFEEPTSGQVLIDGESINHLPPNRRPTAMVFQKYTLWPHMTVFKNVAFGLQLRQLPRGTVKEKVTSALEMVGLGGYEARYPAQLSGGQQQRVAIARALVLEPKILLLDEPFSSLDAHLRIRLRDELKQIQRRLNITTIFVTHDQEEALSLADRIAIMNSGRIEQFDTADAIYTHPASLFAAGFIGSMTMLAGRAEGGVVQLSDHPCRLPAPGLGSGLVTLAVRPEDTLVTRAPGGGHEAVRGARAGEGLKDADGSFPATVQRIINLGPSYQLHLDVPGVGVVKAAVVKSMRPAEGERVHLGFQRYLLYPEGEEQVVEVDRGVQTG